MPGTSHGHLQLDRDAVSYLSPNYDPLVVSGQLTLLTAESIAADPEVVPGISVELFPGHTANMMAVHIQSGREHACFCGDLFPTHHHLDPTWVMGYDLDPLTCIEERKRFLARAVPERWLVLFPHDHELPATTISRNERGRPMATPNSNAIGDSAR